MKPLIQTTGLYLAFGGVVAADNIDFELHEGERLAVIGQNGAGKTTFINICTGYLAPSKGKVYFDGRDVTAMAPRKIVRLGLGRSFQLPQLFTEHTVRQCVQIAAARRNKELSWFRSLESTIDEKEVDATLDLVGLLPEADEASIELPEGKRKLLDVAMALALQPKLLIMDEPTSGVASEDKFALMETVMHALDERRVTSWFVEHDVDIVSRYATRVAAWIAGKVAADGTPAEVLNNPQIKSEVLGA
ncbi:ABC transporter ATP-binding protein [Achromobacter marplatensis]|mgnify:FL=1|jgi:branched-chain amino acid transport system ATP-binding protein|uniref:ATP-binding cassette domain-containing protein n=3 Tax=Achromobacter marplatensis TaxID=470868 RepID=J4YVX5_9BURK|nr:ATP-binding cassette domain-containing protein [Achromobacter marplatensis]EJO33243.1 ABC transporter [Achromobacter marplatensis]MDH2050841.1 ATP-binding cassette domain-containing protein [Achromobacter marplatensis]OWT59318.1 ABC transporter ATP-binding protein [Achromobacter marplatensis]RBP16239.1 amino acid/amide ABC transporter ATP-binding protein 1 (HAAT family) [Achromobacter marplatensis]CAB3686913.1 Energy-coupling factor transporter ATP-binding protein EcfA2 [Achromobacter marpl